MAWALDAGNFPVLCDRLTVGKKGYRRPLQKEDLWHYDDARLAANVAERLQTNIDKRLAQGKANSKYLLLASLNATFFYQFWFAGFLKVYKAF